MTLQLSFLLSWQQWPIISALLSRFWIMICHINAFELLTNRNFQPELHGEARYSAAEAIVDWKPSVMA